MNKKIKKLWKDLKEFFTIPKIDKSFFEDQEYIVDITKPPIFPPCRTIRCGFFGGDYETKESKERTKRWREYSEEYRKALNESKK